MGGNRSYARLARLCDGACFGHITTHHGCGQLRVFCPPLARIGVLMPRLIVILALLSACGADGPPVKPGLTVSGEASIGVVSR